MITQFIRSARATRTSSSPRPGRPIVHGGTVAVLVAVLLAGCTGPSTMRIVNRTKVVLLVDTGRSTLVVQACTERTVALVSGVWGGDGTHPRLDEEAPPGAYALALHDQAVTPPIEGRNDRTIVVTADYVGYTYGSSDPISIGGTGTFPANAAALECAGAPPPLPSPASSDGASQGPRGRA